MIQGFENWGLGGLKMTGPMLKNFLGRFLLFAIFCIPAMLATGCENNSSSGSPDAACAETGETLNSLESIHADINYGFYTDFNPVSYAKTQNPDDPAFNTPFGYEPDLIAAAERLSGNRIRFNHIGIGSPFSGIWLKSASEDFDLVGGGITALEQRRFTSGRPGTPVTTFGVAHIQFRQSLLVHANSAIMSHDDLDGSTRVGVVKDTTGESYLLRVTGITDEEGYVRAGTVIVLKDVSGDESTLTTGERTHRIRSSGSTEGIENRVSLQAGDDAPVVIYFSSEEKETEAITNGDVDALAGSRIGHLVRAHASDGRLKVTAVDTEVSEGGAFSYPNTPEGDHLRQTMNSLINCLTDNGSIGFPQWHENPRVFFERAKRNAF